LNLASRPFDAPLGGIPEGLPRAFFVTNTRNRSNVMSLNPDDLFRVAESSDDRSFGR